MEEEKVNKDLEKIWDFDALVLFSKWLFENKKIGHGLLCVHGVHLAFKIGTLLQLKWEDLIDSETGFIKDVLVLEGEEKRKLGHFFQNITNEIFEKVKMEEGFKLDDYIYKHYKTKKVLTSATLKRELQTLYSNFKMDLSDKFGLKVNFRKPSTNMFEKAWGRQVVKHYNYTKKSFMKVSKFLGHGTLKLTIEFLECEINDEIELLFDFGEPSDMLKTSEQGLLPSKLMLKKFLTKSIALLLQDTARQLRVEDDIRKKVPSW